MDRNKNPDWSISVESQYDEKQYLGPSVDKIIRKVIKGTPGR